MTKRDWENIQLISELDQLRHENERLRAEDDRQTNLILQYEQQLAALRGNECPKCGRSLPPDGDCYGCVYDAAMERIGHLEGKRAKATKRAAYWCDQAGGLNIELEQAREALRFYADPKHHLPVCDHDAKTGLPLPVAVSIVQQDGGKRARRAFREEDV